MENGWLHMARRHMFSHVWRHGARYVVELLDPKVEENSQGITGDYDDVILGGGFKYFLCSSLPLGKCSNLTNIFSDGLKPPTSHSVRMCFFISPSKMVVWFVEADMKKTSTMFILFVWLSNISVSESVLMIYFDLYKSTLYGLYIVYMVLLDDWFVSCIWLCTSCHCDSYIQPQKSCF